LFKLKQSICYPGYGVTENEDIVGYGKDYFFVMDGASCLSGKNFMGSGSDAAWMVSNIQRELCKLLDAGDNRSTEELLRQVIQPLKEEYLTALEAQHQQSPDDSPSAGLALFRQQKDRVEFFGLGDCVGVATLPDGEAFYSLDTDLPNLDHSVLEQMLHIHKTTGADMAEAKRQCNDLLIKNRKLRNHPDGYWILDLMSDTGLDNARKFSWQLSQPIPAGGFSDGFAQQAELFGFYRCYTDLFQAMQETDLEEMFQRLCAAQDADPKCIQFPRFKHRDDTCAMWGTFIPD